MLPRFTIAVTLHLYPLHYPTPHTRYHAAGWFAFAFLPRLYPPFPPHLIYRFYTLPRPTIYLVRLPLVDVCLPHFPFVYVHVCTHIPAFWLRTARCAFDRTLPPADGTLDSHYTRTYHLVLRFPVALPRFGLLRIPYNQFCGCYYHGYPHLRTTPLDTRLAHGVFRTPHGFPLPYFRVTYRFTLHLTRYTDVLRFGLHHFALLLRYVGWILRVCWLVIDLPVTVGSLPFTVYAFWILLSLRWLRLRLPLCRSSGLLVTYIPLRLHDSAPVTTHFPFLPVVYHALHTHTTHTGLLPGAYTTAVLPLPCRLLRTFIRSIYATTRVLLRHLFTHHTHHTPVAARAVYTFTHGPTTYRAPAYTVLTTYPHRLPAVTTVCC